MTHRLPSLSSLRVRLRVRLRERLPQRPRLGGGRADPAAFLAGAAAAGLGLGGLAVVVVALWISSPSPDEGIDGALRVAADLWLLAHGAGLVRAGTSSGMPAPVGVTPLLLTALPAWLLYRAGADAVASSGPRGVAGKLGRLVAGYAAVGAGAVTYTSYGPLRCDAPGALLRLPFVAFAAAGAGVWAQRGRPRSAWLPRAVPDAVARSAAAGTVVLLGGGALLTAGSLLCHAGAVGESFGRLSAGASGRFAVFVLALALVPNAVVWGASYGLGPGFAVGAGTVAPAGASGYHVLPDFPLLAALPAPGPGTPLTWAALVVPVLAGAAVGWFAAASATAWRRVVLNVLLAALGCGVAVVLLSGYASGPLGSASLAAFGPSWGLTGVFAFLWTAAVGVPCALALRWWESRRVPLLPGPGPVPVDTAAPARADQAG
jgi:hypothetical protein